MKDDNVIPEVHVAEMLGVTRKTLHDCCERLGIKYFREENVPRRQHAHWIFINDLPSILRDLIARHILPPTWNESAIEEGMQGLKEIQDRPRNGIRRKKQLVDEEEEDEAPSVPRKKREYPSGGEQEVLKQMQAMHEEALSMMGAQGLEVYLKSERWRKIKAQALEESIQQAMRLELPSLREQVKAELRIKYESIVEKEVRNEKKAKQDDAEVLDNVMTKKRGAETSPPPPTTPVPNNTWTFDPTLYEKNLTE